MEGFELAATLVATSDFQNFFWGPFLPSARWSRDTVKVEGFELAATLMATSDFKTSFWGLCGHQRTPQEGENGCVILGKRLGRPQNRITAFLQGIMLPRALVDCKYEAIRAVARDPVKME